MSYPPLRRGRGKVQLHSPNFKALSPTFPHHSAPDHSPSHHPLPPQKFPLPIPHLLHDQWDFNEGNKICEVAPFWRLLQPVWRFKPEKQTPLLNANEALGVAELIPRQTATLSVWLHKHTYRQVGGESFRNQGEAGEGNKIKIGRKVGVRDSGGQRGK